jgi:hypothetical protein
MAENVKLGLYLPDFVEQTGTAQVQVEVVSGRGMRD